MYLKANEFIELLKQTKKVSKYYFNYFICVLQKTNNNNNKRATLMCLKTALNRGREKKNSLPSLILLGA